MSTFCQRSDHRKCQCRGKGGQKIKILSNVVCEQSPMTRFTNQPTFFETEQNNWSYVTMIHFIKSLKMNMYIVALKSSKNLITQRVKIDYKRAFQVFKRQFLILCP